MAQFDSKTLGPQASFKDGFKTGIRGMLAPHKSLGRLATALRQLLDAVISPK